MTNSFSRIAALAAVAISLGLSAPAFAAGGETPSPPAGDSKSGAPKGSKGDTKKDDAANFREDPAFIKGYRAAYGTVYERQDYAAAIVQLKALGQDDRADVANLIGYSYRKLNDYDQSKTWYERALKADPNHVRTWQYYGLWQVERGDREQAKFHLSRIAEIAGKDSAEYRSLSNALGREDFVNSGGY